MTHRQFLAWREWRRLDMDEPGKVEWYLMQVAREVKAVLASDPSSIDVNKFKMRFTREGEEKKPQPMSPEKAKYLSKLLAAQAMHRFGGNVTIKYVDKHGNPVDPPHGK